MKFTNHGLQFKYYGDTLTRKWPWIKTFGKTHEREIYWSDMHKRGYLSLRDYWQRIGAHEEALRSKKLSGFMNAEVALEWAQFKFPDKTIIIMRDINKMVKNSNFWKSVPQEYRMELLKDVVVLFFPDQTKAKAVVESMSVEFAECYMIHNNKIVQHNLDDQSGLQRHGE